jgi:hypothetical protein
VKIFRYLLVLLIVIFLLTFGCVKSNPENIVPSTSNNTNNNSEFSVTGEISSIVNDPSSPTYFVNIVTDEDFLDLIDEFGQLVNFQQYSKVKGTTYRVPYQNQNEEFTNFEGIIPSTTSPEEYEKLLKIIDIISEKENLINKMKQFRKGVNNLLKHKKRHSFLFEIKGELKDKIENVLRKTNNFTNHESAEHLYVDFRDLMSLNLLFEHFIFIYDNREEFIETIKTASDVSNYENINEKELLKIFNEDFTKELTYFLITYPNLENLSFTDPEFLNDLKNTLDKISDISEEKDYLDMNDIFAANAFVLNWVDDIIYISDIFLKTIVEINLYEIENTNEKGFRSDGKITLTTFGRNPESDNLSITLNWYNKPIITEIPEGLTINLNGDKINLSTRMIDILKVLDKTLPNDILTLEINYATSSLNNGEKVDAYIYNVLKCDIKKLNTSSIDLKNNNLKIHDGILKILDPNNVNSLILAIENIKNNNYTQDDINIIISNLKTIIDNLDFITYSYDEISHKLELEFKFILQNGAISNTFGIIFTNIPSEIPNTLTKLKNDITLNLNKSTYNTLNQILQIIPTF